MEGGDRDAQDRNGSAAGAVSATDRSLEKFWTAPPQQRRPQQAPSAAAAASRHCSRNGAACARSASRRAPAPMPRGRGPQSSTEPFMNAVYDAAQYMDGTDPQYTWMSTSRAKRETCRCFPTAMSRRRARSCPGISSRCCRRATARFRNGSGRLELAEKIFTDAAPLAARVIVNRVWGWHFGKPLVATPSDFGVQGEKPTHPELLDDLAARFIAQWLVAEVAASRDHAVRGLPAVQPAAGRRAEGG